MEDLRVNIKERKKGIPLVGDDVLPRLYEDRVVSPVKLIAIWFAMAIEITLFMSAAQLYDSLPVWQIILSCLVGHCLLFIVMWVTQDIGIKYGIPFSVSLRPAFGYAGALIATYFRAIPAIFWFGFQTWVAASAMNSISVTMWDFDNLVLWIIIVGIIQIVHTTFGIKAVSRLSVIATPLLIIVGVYIAYIAFSDPDVNFSNIWTMQGSGEGGASFMYAAISFMGGWATLAISVMDITRDCETNAEEAKSFAKVTKKYLPAQFIGIIPAVVFYTFVGVLGVVTTGESNPADILVALNHGGSDVMLVVCLLFILIATWCTNDTANLFPAGYALTTTFPKHVNFAKGIIIAGVIGLVAQPWNAADSLVNVMAIIGNLLAPVSGIIISDYFFLRKRSLNVDDLYDNEGQYKYFHNINPAAFISLVVSYGISLIFGDYAFFVALFMSAILYYILMRAWIMKKYPQKDIK